MALARAPHVAQSPGGSYNPLVIYGGVGLGKTHLMHAVGNALRARKPDAKIIYLHSERCVADMVKALQLNAINEFKRFYRTVAASYNINIQDFAYKQRSQSESRHRYTALTLAKQHANRTHHQTPTAFGRRATHTGPHSLRQ